MIIKPRRFLALICPVRLRGTLTSRKLKQLKGFGILCRFRAQTAYRSGACPRPSPAWQVRVRLPGPSRGCDSTDNGCINKLITVLSNQEMPEWDFQTPKDLIGYPKCYISLVSLFYVYACMLCTAIVGDSLLPKPFIQTQIICVVD